MQDFLKDFPVVIEIPIAWGDMDAFQHVNNVMYFRYFESARIAYFEKLNFNDHMIKTGIGPILADTQCKFKIPLTYPDKVSVGAKVNVIEKDRFLMKYMVVSHKHKNIAAIGDGMLVSFNYHENTKAPIPDEISTRITDLEKNVNKDFQIALQLAPKPCG
jgi:acyl-CoA thioester hydrolase